MARRTDALGFDEAKLEITRHILEGLGSGRDIQTLYKQKWSELRDRVDLGDRTASQLQVAVLGVVVRKYDSLYDWESGLDS